MRTILERAGLSVSENDDGGVTTLRVEGDGALRATELTHQITAHFVDRVDVDRAARLEETRRRTDHGLWTVVGLVALGLLVLSVF